MSSYCWQRWIIFSLATGILGITFASPTPAQTPPSTPSTDSQLSNPKSEVTRPEVAFEQGDITFSIQKWGSDIRQGKNVTTALYNRSQAYIVLNQYEFALKDLDELIRIKSQKTSAEVYIIRGIALTEMNQFPAAIESFNQAEKIQPSPLVYNNRALTYQRLGQVDLALKDLIKSVKLAPIPTHRINLANLQNKLGQYNQAVNGMSKLISLKPNFLPAYLTRGIAYYNLGQSDKALRDFFYGIKGQPNNADAYYYAGLSFAKLNRKKDASQNLVRAANLYLQNNQSAFYHQVLEKMIELKLQ